MSEKFVAISNTENNIKRILSSPNYLGTSEIQSNIDNINTRIASIDVTVADVADNQVGRKRGEKGAEIFNDYKSNTATGDYSHAEGNGTTSSGAHSHAEGSSTVASGAHSHAEGQRAKAKGGEAHAEGNWTEASGIASHSEGIETIASGQASHSEGQNAKASATWSHAEGYSTQANGNASHAEGNETKANGEYSHSEGSGTKAIQFASHAEGMGTSASGYASHSEGDITVASGYASHAEGQFDIGLTPEEGTRQLEASGTASHAEGSGTIAEGNFSHSEGRRTKAFGEGSHAEGMLTRVGTKVASIVSYDITNKTITFKTLDGLEFKVGETFYLINANTRETLEVGKISNINTSTNTLTFSSFSSITTIDTSVYYGVLDSAFENGDKVLPCEGSHAEGYNTKATGQYSHSEGYGNVAQGASSHSEGENSLAMGKISHAEGWQTFSFGEGSHTEGGTTKARGKYSHAEGSQCVASGNYSHAEGSNTKTGVDEYKVVSYNIESKTITIEVGLEPILPMYFEQIYCLYGQAYKNNSSVYYNFGKILSFDSSTNTITVSNFEEGATPEYVFTDDLYIPRKTYGGKWGQEGHVEGHSSVAIGRTSHAEGNATTATSDDSHVQGRYNIRDIDNKYAHIVGNGKDYNSLSNAHTLDWNGNAWFAGDVKIGGTSYDDGETLIKKSELSKLKKQSIPQGKAEGSSVKISDGLSGEEPLSLKLWGNTGKNMLKATDLYGDLQAQKDISYSQLKEDERNCIRFIDSLDLRYRKASFKENTQYTISMDCKTKNRENANTEGSVLFVFYYTDNTHSDAITLGRNTTWTHKTGTSEANKTVSAIGIRSRNYANWCYVDVNTFQLEEGATATDYEEYQALGTLNSTNGKYEISVSATGKNLLDITGRTTVDSWSFSNTAKRVLTGHQIIQGCTANNYASKEKVTISKVADESISLKSTASAYGVGLDVEICPNTEYHISGNSGNIGRIAVGLYDKDGNFLKTFITFNDFTFTTLALTLLLIVYGSGGNRRLNWFADNIFRYSARTRKC